MTSHANGGLDRPKVIWSWAMYDWANSAFTTLVVTFIYSTYFTKGMAPDEVTGTAWWSRAVSISAILTALASPVFGAAADRVGRRLVMMGVLALLCFAELALVRLRSIADRRALPARALGVVRAVGQESLVVYVAHLVNLHGEPLVIPALNRDGDCLSDLVMQMFGTIASAESMLFSLTADGNVAVAMAEAPHGTAPKLQGRNVANPLAMLLAAASKKLNVAMEKLSVNDGTISASPARTALGSSADRSAAPTEKPARS